MHTVATAHSELVADLVAANHILFNEGIVDGFGHVSVRHDQDPSRFLIARAMAPALVTADDLMVCDLDGTPHDAQGRRGYAERFIHSAIYAARPDVQAIVHSHSPSMLPFGITGARLRPICHMSGFLGSGAPVFEIRHAIAEPTDLLVRSQALGEALAQTLGDAAVALMRGHGSVAVGRSIREVVYRAIYAEVNARTQMQSLQLSASGGEPVFLNEGEARVADASMQDHLDRPWEMWKARVTAGG